MATVLNSLGTFLHEQDYIDKSRQMILAMETRFTRFPAAYSKWASLALSEPQNQNIIAVVGANAVSLIKDLLSGNLQGALVFGSKNESSLPYFEHRYVNGKTLIYICSGTHCLAPVETVEEAIKLLKGQYK